MALGMGMDEEGPRYVLGRRLARWAEFFDDFARVVWRSLAWALPVLVGMRVFAGAPEWMVWPPALVLALLPQGLLWARDRVAERAERVFDEEIARIDWEMRQILGGER